MVLLVQCVENLRVSMDLIQALAGIHPRLIGEREGELPHGPKRLYLFALLVEPRLTAQRRDGLCGPGQVLCHDRSLHASVDSDCEMSSVAQNFPREFISSRSYASPFFESECRLQFLSPTSIAFVSGAGTERLYAGVTNNTASNVLTCWRTPSTSPAGLRCHQRPG